MSPSNYGWHRLAFANQGGTGTALRLLCNRPCPHYPISRPILNLRLASLAANLLIRITDAFALVGFRRAQLADVRSDLAEQLLVIGANDQCATTIVHREADTGRRHDQNVVRE